MAIREDEIASEAMGVNISRYKVTAFVIGAVLAGVAGSFYAHFVSYIDPLSFSADESVVILSMVVLGGMGNMAGAVLGAILLVVLPEALRFLAQYRMLIYGFVLVIMMMVRPQGILGSFQYDILSKG